MINRDFLSNANIPDDELWFNDKILPKNFEAIVNPVLREFSDLEIYQYEECISFPGIRAKVKRFDSIEIEKTHEGVL